MTQCQILKYMTHSVIAPWGYGENDIVAQLTKRWKCEKEMDLTPIRDEVSEMSNEVNKLQKDRWMTRWITGWEGLTIFI